ncbi:osmC-like protein [Seminavis robusta]|uniref:OsmC-like protein n=1 Tax=Seminavis robusta TaxID=568900 RepID=A0A9N8DC45_9STRA|nr:osmC-like protein [Seminavis robusta]|eukprot:Sro55_g032190.1 osmC-like protein (538) ;mRNA; f:30235-31943
MILHRLSSLFGILAVVRTVSGQCEPCLSCTNNNQCRADSDCTWSHGDCVEEGSLCQPCSSCTNNDQCMANSDCIWSQGNCVEAPTPAPAPPIDGICTCAKSDCDDVCDSKSNNAGDSCVSDNDCPPNGNQGGACMPVQTCGVVPCPLRPTTELPSPTYKAGFYDNNVLVYDKYRRAVSLSDGLNGRAIAYSGEPVQLYDPDTGECAGFSSSNFHGKPDAAEVFPAPGGGWYYASNAETTPGGVFTLEFDSTGRVIDYFPLITSTSRNCGGGDTPWGSWVTCEELGSNGHVYQTDPSGNMSPRLTSVVDTGGNYESFAYYIDSNGNPTFYTTNDSNAGPLVRFTPDAAGMACFNAATNAEKWCTLESGSHDFLELIPTTGSQGTFAWGEKANANPNRYPFAEGIDVVGDMLYFISKTTKFLFILDLINMTYERSSTQSGAFNNQPDQIQRIVNDPNQIVYFCEDGGPDCGVHGRDATAQFFSILDGPGYNTETTGLAFSSDHNYMFLSFQGPGVIWQFWREDGRAFTDTILDIKYHAA